MLHYLHWIEHIYIQGESATDLEQIHSPENHTQSEEENEEDNAENIKGKIYKNKLF